MKIGNEFHKWKKKYEKNTTEIKFGDLWTHFFLRKPVDHETAVWACCKTAAVSQCPQLSISEGTNTKLHDVLKEKPIDLLIWFQCKFYRNFKDIV